MRIAVVRRALKASFSMDVYADGLVSGLKAVRPNWEIVEITPNFSEYQGSVASRVGKYYQRYWQFPRQIQQQADVDLFHIVDHSDAHLVYGLAKANRASVVTCHDLINYIQPENLDNQAIFPFVSRSIWNYSVRGLRQADQIVTVSNHTAQDVTAVFNITPTKLTTAHNGVDASYQPLSRIQIKAVRKQYEIDEDTFCWLNVGSNHPRKNVSTLLEALALLRQQNVSVCFVKAGADFTDRQKDFINCQNLADCVRYVQKPDKAALRKLYSAADALVAPSLYEGFGITVLEAMACGTPVIASNVTSLPEVVGHAGIMVPPKDVEAIAKATLTLKTCPDEVARLSRLGLQRVQAFTWQNAAEIVANVYEKALIKPPT